MSADHRVLHLVQCGPTTGGTVSHVATQVAHQRSRGLRVAVVAGSEGVLAERCRLVGADVFVDPALLPSSPLDGCDSPQGALAIAERWGPDLIHSHLMHAGFVGQHVATSLGRPHIYTQHMYTPIDPLVRTMRAVDADAHVIAVARFGHAAISEYLEEPDRVHLVPNGVDAPELSDFRLETSGVGPHLLYCGRLSPEKGADLAILAFVEIGRALPDAVLHIVGTGPDHTLLERVTRALGLEDRVRFYGSISGALHPHAGADLLLAPSRGDAASLVLLEAMASGIPIIAARVGGTAELIRDDVDGVLVEPDSPAQLAAAALSALGDDDRRVVSARNRHAALFTAERMAADTLEVYGSVLS
ncbi:glycosyltransferase family 4 protein [Microbacterium oxydans]|uniref:glycosyltransferase family 4 protein n=1 Tax=Microbacterium oxydans TaxID=82380 RepID=UPI0022B172F0|nr:glycosyltransferase family 4 protein [Microbacterium oxydans]MCZ4300187.1 glycosyltransferase family 4 protein [Microbacterium oxydans]